MQKSPYYGAQACAWCRIEWAGWLIAPLDIAVRRVVAKQTFGWNLGMVVLGVNLGHDSTAALVIDGKITAAVAEERLSRRKCHLGFPWRSIPQVLQISGVAPREVTVIALSFNEYLCAPPFLTRALLNTAGCSIPLDDEFGLGTLAGELGRQLLWEKTLSLPFPYTSKRFEPETSSLYCDALRQLDITADMVPVEHHLSHAASCYYTSPYQDCLVITADGAGDGLAGVPWGKARL